MKPRVMAALAVALLYAAACNEITYPTPPEPTPPSAPLPTNILLSATPDRLPVSGGTSTVSIRVIASGGGGVGAAKVKVSSTEGELDAGEVATDDDGNASVQWTTAKSGSVIARLGAIVASVTIPVQDAPPPPAPIPPGPPPPPPPGEPVLLVDIFTSGDLDVLSNIHFAAAAKLSTTSAGVAIAAFAWDFEGDGTIDSRASSPAHTYPRGGEYTVTLDVTAVDGRRGRGTRRLAVGSAPPPSVAVSLVANPSTVVTGANVTLTASATPTKTAGIVTTYEWDVDGDGAIDGPPATSPSMITSYATTGTRTARVTARTSTGHSGTASAVVTVGTPPPPTLVVTLSAAPTTLDAGGTVTFTTAISGLATGETLGQIVWDFDGNGTADAVRNGNEGAPIAWPFPTSGFFDAKVTVETSTGRTATATRRITVTTP